MFEDARGGAALCSHAPACGFIAAARHFSGIVRDVGVHSVAHRVGVLDDVVGVDQTQVRWKYGSVVDQFHLMVFLMVSVLSRSGNLHEISLLAVSFMIEWE